MVPPGPIPNPEVKHQHVDGSRTTGPARVDSCQGKQSPQNESSAGFSVCRRSLQISSERSEDIDHAEHGFRPARHGQDFVSRNDECQLTSGDWEMQGQSKYGTSVFAAAQLRRDRKVPCLDDETGKSRASMINAAAYGILSVCA